MIQSLTDSIGWVMINSCANYNQSSNTLIIFLYSFHLLVFNAHKHPAMTINVLHICPKLICS